MKSRNDVPKTTLDKITAKMRDHVSQPEGLRIGTAMRMVMDMTGLSPGESDRLADRIIQRWRRKGFIAFKRNGKITTWHLTEGTTSSNLT